MRTWQASHGPSRFQRQGLTSFRAIAAHALLALALPTWAAGETSKPATRMVYGETGRLESFDPYTIHEASGHRLADLLFDSLIELSPAHSYEPGLAKAWQISADGTYVTLELRERVTWHPQPGENGPGLPLTPADVVATIALLSNPASELPNRDRFAALLTARAVGRSRVIVHFRQALADPLRLLTFKVLPSFAFPAAAGGALKRGSAFSRQPLGTGPYRFVEATPQGEVRLEAHRQHYKGAPPLEQLIMKTYADQTIMAQSLMFHSLDLLTYVSPRHLAEIGGDAALQLVPYDALAFSFIAFNTSRGVLQDKRVRQALSCAINRPEMLSAFFQDQGELVSGPFAPSSWAYNLDVKPLAFDPQRADALLSSAGLTRLPGQSRRDAHGKPLRLTFAVPIAGESELVKRIVLAYQAYLAATGIELELKFMDWSVWKRKVLGEHDYDLTLAAWNFDDASNIKSLFHSAHASAWGNNFVAYRNNEVDALLGEAEHSSDFDKKRAIYQKLHHILADEAPYTYLWTLKHHAAHNNRLTAVRVEPFAFFKHITRWSLVSHAKELL